LAELAKRYTDRPWLAALYTSLPSALSVSDLLSTRIVSHGMVPLTGSIPWVNGGRSPGGGDINVKDQWVTEVKTWFMSGILNGIFYTRNGARFHLNNWASDLSDNYKKAHSLCGRILFRESSYTNIDLVGFWITTIAFILIYILSYIVEWVHQAIKSLWKFFVQAT